MIALPLAPLLLAAAAASPNAPAEPPPSEGGGRLAYPAARRDDVVDDYFGTQVADPYRWLEDDNSAETAAWVQAENRLTESWLADAPGRQALRERLTRLWSFERLTSRQFPAPWRRGGRTFYVRNTGLQNQAVLMVSDGPGRPGRVLLDPNALSADGTVALLSADVSQDGKLLAYALSEAGSDWTTLHVREVATGVDRPDLVRWTKFGGASWRKDGSGFWYSRFPEPAPGEERKGATQGQQVWFHRLGTPQSADRLVYARPDHPDWYLSAGATDDGRWLVITAEPGTNPETALYLLDLRTPGARPEPLLDRLDAHHELLDVVGETFYVRTNQGAPRYRVVAVRRGHPDPAEWKEVVPEGPGRDVLQAVSLVGDRFLCTWMRDVHHQVEVRDRAGRKLADLPLPGLGEVQGFYGKRTDRDTFYLHTGFTSPPTVYRLDLRTLRSEVFHRPRIPMDLDAFEAEQVFYPSKDGTRVPMFLVHRKGLPLDGQNPTLLYGYGGFRISLTPWFSPANLLWVELGGVFAVANLRGGEEYGQAWYDAGRLQKKQNVFDDFIAAAEWLVANRYTSTPRLAIEGGSNGGLLVGAVMTQRPDLFGAAVPEVGVMDMLRFHKFTVGWGWKSDYGSSETREGFETLYRYSPLHNLRPGTRYPPTLVTTADHDDRVVPAHSFKFTAALQAAQAGPAPVLARIETRAGHGAGKPIGKAIEERADIYAFLAKVMGMKVAEAGK